MRNIVFRAIVSCGFAYKYIFTIELYLCGSLYLQLLNSSDCEYMWICRNAWEIDVMNRFHWPVDNCISSSCYAHLSSNIEWPATNAICNSIHTRNWSLSTITTISLVHSIFGINLHIPIQFILIVFSMIFLR